MKSHAANPFCTPLIIASLVFVVTALAHSLVPWMQQPLWLRSHGWQLLLVEVAAIIILGLLSMGVDRYRSQGSGVRNQKADLIDDS